MESDLSLKVPKTFFDNFEIVCKYQNMQLIRAICEWKGWGEDRVNEITSEFFNGEPLERSSIKQSKLVKSEDQPKVKKLVKKLSVEKTVYVQKPIIIEGKNYLLEEPSDNVYDYHTGEFLGVYYKCNGVGKINDNAQEN